MDVIAAQAPHVVTGARSREVTQFVELVMKDGEQCAKRKSVSHLCACLDKSLGSIDDTGVADICAAKERQRWEVARSDESISLTNLPNPSTCSH